jgi:hypothetical protein
MDRTPRYRDPGHENPPTAGENDWVGLPARNAHDVAAQGFRVPGLEHLGALKVPVAVKSGREDEMALEQGPGLLENPQYYFFVHLHGIDSSGLIWVLMSGRTGGIRRVLYADFAFFRAAAALMASLNFSVSAAAASRNQPEA